MWFQYQKTLNPVFNHSVEKLLFKRVNFSLQMFGHFNLSYNYTSSIRDEPNLTQFWILTSKYIAKWKHAALLYQQEIFHWMLIRSSLVRYKRTLSYFQRQTHSHRKEYDVSQYCCSGSFFFIQKLHFFIGSCQISKYFEIIILYR